MEEKLKEQSHKRKIKISLKKFFSFSLTSLILLVVLFNLYFFYQHRLLRAKRLKDVQQVLEKHGRYYTIDELFELTELNLAESNISSAGLKEFSALWRLKHLDLSKTSVSSKGIAFLKDLKSLSSLNVSYTKLEDATLEVIKGLPNLTILDISANRRVTDKGLVHLKDCIKLKKLFFSSACFYSKGKAKELGAEKVFMAMDDVTDQGLEHLRHLTSLEFLSLPSNITGKGLIYLENLKKLKELDCSFCLFFDYRNLVHLKYFPKLTKLSLRGCLFVDDKSLFYILQLKKLKELDLRGTKISKKAFESLKTKIPNCNIKWIKRRSINFLIG